jgi:hypothetical protein
MGESSMCDYSLQHVLSRPAKVGERLVTRNFGTGTRGFCAIGEPNVAICLLPGTELAFTQDVDAFSPTAHHRTAIFRQVNKHVPQTHHDALELPDGQLVLLTQLIEGQEATVLQLPAQPTTAEEVEEQRRAAFAG